MTPIRFPQISKQDMLQYKQTNKHLSKRWSLILRKLPDSLLYNFSFSNYTINNNIFYDGKRGMKQTWLGNLQEVVAVSVLFIKKLCMVDKIFQ